MNLRKMQRLGIIKIYTNCRICGNSLKKLSEKLCPLCALKKVRKEKIEKLNENG